MARTKKLLKDHAPELYAQIQQAITNAPRWYPEIDIPSIGCNDNIAVWWECPNCPYVWQNTVKSRYTKQSGCPYCTNRIIVSGFNCLKTKHPDIYAQLHKELNKQAGIKIKRLSPGTPTIVWWQCPQDSEHIWKAPVGKRTGGNQTGCPHCASYKNEREFRELFNKHTNLPFTSEHITAPRELFIRDTIQIDLLNEAHKIAIEYDGHWSHGGNPVYKRTKEECQARDLDSSNAILNAGYTLIRIRETPLTKLPIKHPNYIEYRYTANTDKAPTLHSIIDYLQKHNKHISYIEE